MGGKSKADNSAVVQQQQQEAADAKQKEADRQARLNQGLASIKSAFEGSPVMGTKATPFDWSTFTANNPNSSYKVDPTTGQASYNDPSNPSQYGLPTGYKVIKTTKPSTSSAASGGTQFGQSSPTSAGPTYDSSALAFQAQPGQSSRTSAGPTYDSNALTFQAQPGQSSFGQGTTVSGDNTFGHTKTSSPTPAGGSGDNSVWAIQGPDGKIYYQGDQFSVDQSYDTGQTTGGFDDAFYNKYKQAVLDYYMPQVDKQYKDAKDELTYRLARSGNIRSSAANTATADLSTQNDLNQAGVRNQADTAAGDLRTQVASERAKATSQLYATEDPEVAANQALSAVSDISLQQPDLSPLTALFNVATVGGANVLKGYQAQNTANTFNTALAKSRDQRVVS
jgi:hypothetical protein